MLDRIFGDLARQEFFARYWLREPLFIPRQEPALFEDLISTDDIYEAIFARNVRFPELTLVQNNQTYPWKAYCREFRRDGVSVYIPNPDDVIARFRGGATIQLRVLHMAMPKVGAVARQLEGFFGSQVSAIGFLAPPAARSFEPHVDAGGTFVVQIFGSKLWRVPRRINSNDFSNAIDFALGPGSVLYLPPGWWHHTLGGDSVSLGVSFEVRHQTIGDLLNELIRELEANVPVNRHLPLTVDGIGNLAGFGPLEKLREQLQANLRKLTERGVRDLIARRFDRERLPADFDRFLDTAG